MKVRVYHASHGCETGCCGHMVEIGEEGRKQMEFAHPSLGPGDREAQKKAWAIEFAREVVKENWPECLSTIDWETIEFDEVYED